MSTKAKGPDHSSDNRALLRMAKHIAEIADRNEHIAASQREHVLRTIGVSLRQLSQGRSGDAAETLQSTRIVNVTEEAR
jgi:hypothetical protein